MSTTRERLPLDDITDTGTITGEGYPIPMVLCPLGGARCGQNQA